MDLSEEKYEELVELIYAAIKKPDGWYEFCKTLACALDATLAQIVALDMNYQALSFSVMAGLQSPADLAQFDVAYLQHPVDQDPRWAAFLSEDIVDWMQCHHFVSDEFVAQSRLYQEILLPFNSRYLSAYKLLNDQNITVALAICTSESRKPLRSVELDFLNRLIPHLKRVDALQKQIYHFSTGALVGYSLIDKLHQPVILLNLAGGVAHANSAAYQLVTLTQLVKIDKQRFTLSEPYHSEFQKCCQALEIRYREGLLTSAAQELEMFMKVVQHTGEILYIFSSLVVPESSMRVFGVRPLIMLTLYHPDFEPTVDMHLLATAFGLTPAECRVALQLMEGSTIKEIANKKQVKLDTVKKQMQAIYEKTDTHRQSDLVKLLLNLPRQAISPNALIDQSLSHPWSRRPSKYSPRPFLPRCVD